MTKKTSLTLSSALVLGLMLSFSSSAYAAPQQEEHPKQTGHLQASVEEMKAIESCAKKEGIEDVRAENLPEEKQKIIDGCYRANGVVPPTDMKAYGTMKGQYY